MKKIKFNCGKCKNIEETDQKTYDSLRTKLNDSEHDPDGRWLCTECINTIIKLQKSKEKPNYGFCGKVLSQREFGNQGERVDCEGPTCQLWIIGDIIPGKFSELLRKKGACSEKMSAMALIELALDLDNIYMAT